ncbi:hypothetical protein [Hyphomonas sp.]|uniref:hypothetical protein n=1 Tax=Hyphomonas sp. TaxID=87 RepID=UPI0025BC3DEC|nr:hypothetical protein [Hyphomonas sp.]
MACKLESGLKLAIKVILDVRSHYQNGDQGWDACDEILHDIHIATDGRSMEVAEALDDLPH